MPSKRFLITGATGIMGAWVLAEGLKRGWQGVAMLRDTSHEAARARLETALRVARHEEPTRDTVRLLLGDNTKPGLGLAREQWDELLPDIDLVIHCAALTSFSTRKDELIWKTNVGGVASVIDALEGSGVPLCHVSTAYVADSPDGVHAPEGPPKPEAECRNAYERSKRAAELLLRDASKSGKIQSSIFRPSIIVGARDDGRIHEFLNFYQLFRLIDLIETGMLPLSETVRVCADPRATLNLVPVDWVAEALWNIIDAGAESGQTYHLTNPAPLALGDIAAWGRARLQRSGAAIEFLPTLEGLALTEMEQYIHTMSRIFLEYVSRPEPLFGLANTQAKLGALAEFPHLDDAFLDTLLGYAKVQSWESAFGKLQNDLRGTTV